jgi:hypothetical protein
MFDTLGNIAAGCVVAIWERRNEFYWTAPQLGKTKGKRA